MGTPSGGTSAVPARRSLTGRERWLIRGVLGAVAAIAVVVALAIASAGRSSADGCIHATIPGPVGAQEVNECGSQARATCQTALAPGSFAAPAARVIARECRKASLPVGR